MQIGYALLIVSADAHEVEPMN